MKRLRNRLVLAFVIVTAIPLIATLWLTLSLTWITLSLVERSLSPDTARDVDQLSQALERTAREFYQQSREQLRVDAGLGRIKPQIWARDRRELWPATVQQFFASGECG